MQTLTPANSGASKHELYQRLCEQLSHLLGGERNFIANAANTAALLYHSLPDVNWVGFYVTEGEELVLGPFQGKPACVRIAIGSGVCGSAVTQENTIVVPDVSKFPGHIACDPVSKSEIVVPLMNWGRVLGVLDVDSASLNRFDEDDHEGLESLVSIFLAAQATDDLPDLSEGAAEN
jgi:L-methionine (R)-S-oxide reductase